MAHLVFIGWLDMEVEVEGCCLVAVGDGAGVVAFVLDMVGMIEGVVDDLARLMRGLVGLAKNLVGIVEGVVVDLARLIRGLVGLVITLVVMVVSLAWVVVGLVVVLIVVG